MHIVLSDRGWIIEELARRLVDALPYVTADTSVDSSATFQYYMTYSARRERVSPVELALFTHREEEPNAARRFDEIAKAVDHAVSMSKATDRLVERLDVRERSCISPGVDFDFFAPKLKIAVVGRTYHTGRKGEALVRAVMDIPDIEWHFTGEGWPGPALKVPQNELPAFYRSMDYVLVPATNEGGPMCVLEALACGTPVIASDVGWAGEFPHIAFERGDARSLRAVLERLRAERFGLRESVAAMTWKHWATAHDTLFARLAKRIAGQARPAERVAPPRRVRTVGLVTHGAEDTTLGGPSVRVPRTQQELERLNLRVIRSARVDRRLADADVIHGFNIWAPLDAYRMARQVQRLGRPFVFSPILLDLSEMPFWGADVLRAFRASGDPADAERRLDHAFANFHETGSRRFDFEPGYSAALAAINQIADATIFLSDHERALFERVTGTVPSNPHLVHNPVDADQFEGVSPDLFRQTHGLDDYVLCVGRLEHRKNQLMLANALASTDLPLVLIGHEADAEYSELIRRFGGSRLRVIGRLDPGSILLRSAVAGARVFTLPSWAEGAPLAALEAGAAGTPLVLSDRSGEREYFGEHASYCDPGSSASIRDAIVEAWNKPRDTARGEALRAMVAERYDWSRHARATRAVYETVAEMAAPRGAKAARTAELKAAKPSGVVFDITTWANNAGTLSGIVRVECAIARALLEREDIEVRFILFAGVDHIVEVPRHIIESGALPEYRKLRSAGFVKDVAINDMSGFADLITVGSSWMQNSSYSAEIALFAERHGLNFNVLMHDFTPNLFPQWYMDGYAGVWTANCRTMLARANRILVYSDSTARDVERFCFENEFDTAPLVRIRLADEIGAFASGEIARAREDIRARFAARPFVLAVGAIHVRKNYGLLFDVWTMLRETMGDALPHLVIVGGIAWNGTDVARAIKEDPRVRGHIHILQDIDDHTLAWLYENCLFTAYPSLYEGWGLPVGESLSRGKICLSSNISSMAEIAPALTDLLPPLDRGQWASRVEHYARSATSRTQRERQIRENYAITSWTDTTNDVLAALHEPARVPAREIYVPGAIALCKIGSGARYLDAGWYHPESWGAWANSKVARLRMRLAHRPNEDMALTIVASLFKQPHMAGNIEVAVNGVVCGTVSFLPETRPSVIGQSVGRLRVPREVIAKADDLTITFEVDELCPVKAVAPQSTDIRELGIGLAAFILESLSLAGDAPRLLSTRPEVRALLGVDPDQDLNHILGEHSTRPSARSDCWRQPLGEFVRHGKMTEHGALSSGGLLALAIGTARLHLDDDVLVELMVGATPRSATPPSLSIYANDQQVASLQLLPNTPYLSFRVPRELLGRSDPLRLLIIGSVAGGGAQADFVLSDFRILETSSLPLCVLPVGHRVGLTNYVPDLPPGGNRMTGQVMLQLALKAVQRDSVLLVDAGTVHAASVETGGTTLVAVAGASGRSLLPIGDKIQGTQRAMLTFSPDESAAASPVPAFDTALHEHAIAHYLLPSLGTPKAPHHRSYLLRDGWNVVEDGGWCWGATDRVSFWVRPGEATELEIMGELLCRLDDPSTLSVTVDDVAANAVIETLEPNRIVVHLPLPRSDAEIRCIEISGLPVARPVDLGLNGDVRSLSIALIDVDSGDRRARWPTRRRAP